MKIYGLLALTVATVGLLSGCDQKTVTEKQANDSTVKETSEPEASDKVLRHAVFFSFKDSTSQEKLKEITDAFVALPSKIPEIVEFQWGENNSPEGKDDGLSHCFLLSFADEKARDVYIPHPAHKAFGSVLSGQNDQVFVIDYWGSKAKDRPAKELKHAVFFKFKDDADPAAVKQVEDAFAALPSKIDAIKGFEWGINNSPERHSHGFTHCFMVTFDSEDGRAAYLPHPDHLAFVEVLKPVLDKVRVMDFWDQTKP